MDFDDMLPVRRLDGGPPIAPTELDPHGIGTVTVAPAAPAGRAFLLARCGPDAEIREVEPGTNAYEYSDPMPMALRFTTKTHKKNKPTRTGRVFFTGLKGGRRELQEGETP